MPSLDDGIETTDERMVFRVPSEKNPKVKYRVDLIANGGYGHCQCTDFATRRQPAIDEHFPADTRATLCKHLVRARRFFLNDLLRTLARNDDREPDAHPRR